MVGVGSMVVAGGTVSGSDGAGVCGDGCVIGEVPTSVIIIERLIWVNNCASGGGICIVSIAGVRRLKGGCSVMDNCLCRGCSSEEDIYVVIENKIRVEEVCYPDVKFTGKDGKVKKIVEGMLWFDSGWRGTWQLWCR